MDFRTGPMQALEISFFLWLFFGLWWLSYSIQNFRAAKAAGTLQEPRLVRYVAGRVVVWLAAGAGILFIVSVFVAGANSGMR